MRFHPCAEFRQRLAMFFCLLSTGVFLQAGVASGTRGIVATVHPLASQAAINAFQRGGNAIDAAIAAALTLGVVDGRNSGIGGGCLMTIRLANGRFVCVDGREMAPLAAYRDLYVREGRVDTRLSQVGPLAVAVPGALLAYETASRRFGRLPLRDHLLNAARVAESGFKLDTAYAQELASVADQLRAYLPGTSAFFNADGSAKKEGETLLQPDLAATYRAIAAQGTAWFYNGPFATRVGDWMAQNGGIIVGADFPLYQIRLRDPVVTSYRGHTIVGFPPPSSGGVHVAEILNIIENFNLKRLGTNSADVVHVVAEAMKLAFADRAYWLGDPDFARVPRGLLNKRYAAQLARGIQTNRVANVTRHGMPPGAGQDFFRSHTTHFSTADAQGNWVACTATINTSFGSKVVVPGTGVLLNNEMDDFAIQPGVPNTFGLVGSEANSIAARKRPLSSMSPTIVLKNGRPILALGGAGGPTIISQAVVTIIGMVDFGMGLEEALAQPRFHHQWLPNELRIESKAGEEVIAELTRRGHSISQTDNLGVTQAVALAPDGRLIGAHDPRVNGQAAGW